MKKWIGMGMLLSLMLVACGNGGSTPQQQPANTVLTEDNSWGGAAPDDAQNLNNADFEAKVKSGELSITGKKDLQAEEAARKAQFEQDKAFLEAIPVGQRSPDVVAILAGKLALPTTAGGDYLVDISNRDGSKSRTVTLGQQSRMRQVVLGYEQANKPQNALEAYRSTFEVSPLAAKQALPTPDSLSGKSTAEILDALYRLNDALASVPHLDGVRVEVASSLSSKSLSALGNGVDTSGTCTPSSAGLYANFFWPLKHFTTPVKQQGMRGTCWGFAAVAGLESREMVVSDRTLNLSEQYFVNKNKHDYDHSEYEEGYSAEYALQNFLDHGEKIPGEGAWSYNQSYGRPSTAADPGVEGTKASFAGACNNYDDYCSETAHQSPRFCTTFDGNTFCGSKTFTVINQAGGVTSSSTTNVWDNAWESKNAQTRLNHFPFYAVRALLASGQALLGSFDVYSGFDHPVAGGFVTDLSENAGRGGHVVLLVGFISNLDMHTRLPNAPDGAGGGYFLVKNSWGCGAADAGYYYLPVNYVTKVFSGLSKLNISSLRGDHWKSEVDGGKGTTAPSLKITAPLVVQKDDLLFPFYANFQKNITFKARADDASDGQDFTDSIDWFSEKRGKIGSGRSITVSMVDSGSSDTVTAKVKDSDGNGAEVSMKVADTYPLVNIAFPLNGTALFTKTAYTLSASAEQFRGGKGQNSELPCATLSWTSSRPGEGPWSGCAPSATFLSIGARTLSAVYILDGRAAMQTVTVQVSDAVPPVTPLVVKVSIAAPKLPFSDATYDNSLEVAFGASVLVDGKAAQCSLLKWYRQATSGPILLLPVGFGCNPKLNVPVGQWKIEANYNDGNGAVGSAFGDVTIIKKFVN